MHVDIYTAMMSITNEKFPVYLIHLNCFHQQVFKERGKKGREDIYSEEKEEKKYFKVKPSCIKCDILTASCIAMNF